MNDLDLYVSIWTNLKNKIIKKKWCRIYILWCSGGGLIIQSCPTLCNPMDCSPQAPLSMGFLRQEYWSGCHFLLQGDLPDPGIEPKSPALQADSLSTKLWGKPILWFYINKIQTQNHTIFMYIYTCVFNVFTRTKEEPEKYPPKL